MMRPDDCTCGHDKTTHHSNAYACLAVFCDCVGYRNHATPAARPPRPSNHPAFCRCAVCKQWPEFGL